MDLVSFERTITIGVKLFKQWKATDFASFGLATDTFSAALGAGRSVVGFAGKNVGTNSMSWLTRDKDGNVQYFNALDAEPKKTDLVDTEFPCVQYHHTFGITGQEDRNNSLTLKLEKTSEKNSAYSLHSRSE